MDCLYLIVVMIVLNVIEFGSSKFLFSDGKVYRAIYWSQGFTEVRLYIIPDY